MNTKMICVALLLSLCTALAGCSHAEEWSPTTAAENILVQILAGDYAAVIEQVDDSVKAQLTAEVLQQGWEMTTAQFGAFVAADAAQEREQGGYTIVTLPLNFERGLATFSIVFTAEGKIGNMLIQPTTPAYKDEEPLPLPDGAVEETVALRAGEADETAATLTLPAGEGPFPAVVLIHGSGASDKDEYVFGVRPFRDIAMGLAAQGIAVLRYDKYTFAHADQFADGTATIEQEYERDVLAAVGALAKDARVGDIYLLGHSEGGMLLPRLLSITDGAAKGGIILAGSPRPLWEIQKMQNEDAIAHIEESKRESMQALVDAEMEKANRIATMTDEELAKETVFGIPAAYHKDLISADPIATAKELGLPLLILQGGKDFQVNPELDFGAWETGLADATFAKFILYPKLTHLFMTLEGPSTVSTNDYLNGGHVSDEVVADIAKWVKER